MSEPLIISTQGRNYANKIQTREAGNIPFKDASNVNVINQNDSFVYNQPSGKSRKLTRTPDQKFGHGLASLMIPGLGQFLKNENGKGFVFLIAGLLTGGSVVCTGFATTPLHMLIAAWSSYDAYKD